MNGVERQTMYCHACQQDFTAELDMDFDGNHVIICPICQHEHCRVVKDGVVTSERWDQRNGDLGAVITASTSTAVYNVSSTASGTGNFINTAWSSSVSSAGYFI